MYIYVRTIASAPYVRISDLSEFWWFNLAVWLYEIGAMMAKNWLSSRFIISSKRD